MQICAVVVSVCKSRRHQRAPIETMLQPGWRQITWWLMAGLEKCGICRKVRRTEEIRLLEVNDHLAGLGPKVEAITFGLDVEGTYFRLSIADVTSEQLDQIKRDPAYLPAGWSLVGKKSWRRGHE